MEQLYMDIIKFFIDYGWRITVLAVSGIFLLGVLKCCGAFSKLKLYTVDKKGQKIYNDSKTKQLKKFLYIILSVGFSVIACSAYLYTTKDLSFLYIATLTIPVWGLNQIAYGLYENLGVRTVWKKLLNKIKEVVDKSIAKTKTPNEFAKQLDKLVNKFKDVDKAKVLTIINQSVNKKK